VTNISGKLEDGQQASRLPKVAILLGSLNGEEFLAEQLESIARQTHRNWQLWISDDGSTDLTEAIVGDYAKRWGDKKVALRRGPASGFSANFLSLVCRAEITADYYAFCDQDDVWEVDKLSRAIGWLATVPPTVPALYCGRTRLVAEDGTEIGLSPLFNKPPVFANALVQSVAGANTMVFNEPARRLIQFAGADVKIISHDWWLYLVVSACGGIVFYDRVPAIRYRQHERNLVGSNMGLRARLIRLRAAFWGRFTAWNVRHIAALEQMLPYFTPECREIFWGFVKARERWVLPRCVGILRCGVFRQTIAGNVGLALASLLGKI